MLIEDNKFTWGDSVIISEEAPKQFHSGEGGDVCGFYKIKSEETARDFLCSQGAWVYTVEFGDGSDIQVAEIYLKKDID